MDILTKALANDSESRDLLELPKEMQLAIGTARSNILVLGDDWDGEGSRSIKETTFDRAELFIKNLFAGLHGDLEIPNLFPGTAGEVEVLWKTNAFQLSLDFPEDQNLPVVYYGDNYDDQRLKGTISFEKSPAIFTVCRVLFG